MRQWWSVQIEPISYFTSNHIFFTIFLYIDTQTRVLEFKAATKFYSAAATAVGAATAAAIAAATTFTAAAAVDVAAAAADDDDAATKW